MRDNKQNEVQSDRNDLIAKAFSIIYEDLRVWRVDDDLREEVISRTIHRFIAYIERNRENLDSVAGSDHFLRRLLLVIARREALSLSRAQKRTKEPIATTEKLSDEDQFFATLSRSISILDQQFLALLLEGYTHSEACTILSIEPNEWPNLRARISRGLELTSEFSLFESEIIKGFLQETKDHDWPELPRNNLPNYSTLDLYFSPEFTLAEASTLVDALSDYYKACGGDGFESDLEYVHEGSRL